MPLLSIWTSTKYIIQFHKFQAIFNCLFNTFAYNYHLKKLYHTKNTSFPQIWWLFTFLNPILWYLKVFLVVKTYKDKFIVINKKWKKIVNLYLVGSPSPRYALQYPNPSCQLSLIIPLLVSKSYLQLVLQSSYHQLMIREWWIYRQGISEHIHMDLQLFSCTLDSSWKNQIYCTIFMVLVLIHIGFSLTYKPCSPAF